MQNSSFLSYNRNLLGPQQVWYFPEGDELILISFKSETYGGWLFECDPDKYEFPYGHFPAKSILKQCEYIGEF